MVVLWLHNPEVSGSIQLSPDMIGIFSVEDEVLQILSSNNPVYYLDVHNKIGQFRYAVVAVTLGIILWVTVPLQEKVLIFYLPLYSMITELHL